MSRRARAGAFLLLGIALAGLTSAACSRGESPGGKSINLEELLRRHTAALGGEEVIEKIQSLRYSLKIVEPGFSVDGIYVVDRRGRMRIDITSQGERVFTEAFDGAAGWQLGAGESSGKELSPGGRSALWHGTQSPQKLFGLHEMSRLGHRVELAGRESLEGVSYYRVRVTLSDGWENLYYLDPVSYLIVRNRDFRALHVDVDPGKKKLEEVVSDDRRVGGVLKSFAAEQIDLETGEVVQTTTLIELEVNPTLEDALFTKP